MTCFFKWVAVVFGSLILLLALVAGSFFWWLKWSGERDWKRAEAELRAKGEKLTFAELVPPMPPDSENFFADPLWAGYSDLVREKQPKGGEVWVTRLPKDQQPLRLWQTVPLSMQERDELARLEGKPASEAKDRNLTDRYLIARTLSGKYPEKKKEAADLMLQLFAPAREPFARIAELARRPQAQFPIHYNLLATEGVIPDLLSEVTASLVLSQMFMNRASCELLLGKNAEAAADTETLLRLSFIQKNDPLLICLLVRISTTALALKVLDQGLADHVWTADQLALYQGLLEKIYLPKNLLFVLRGERTFARESWKALNRPHQGFFSSLELGAMGLLFEKSAAYYALLMQRALEKMQSALKETGWNRSSTQIWQDEQATLEHRPLHRMTYIMVTLAIPGVEGAIAKTAECQTQVDQTIIACALERYRIAHGSYPSSLEALVPDYLAKLLNSPINGKPMNYSLNPDGTLLLWSPGWNLKSLGGKPGEFKGEGDIVWGQPVPKTERPKADSSKGN